MKLTREAKATIPGHPTTADLQARYWSPGPVGHKPGDILEHDAPGILITTDRDYARVHAGYQKGGLYRVEPIGELSEHDTMRVEAWGAPAVRILSVYDRLVTITDKQLKTYLRRWQR